MTLNVANAVGVVALIITVVALTRRSNRGLLATLGFSVLLWAGHYGLLGSMSGASVHLVAAIGLFAAHLMQSASTVARAITGATFSISGVACT